MKSPHYTTIETPIGRLHIETNDDTITKISFNTPPPCRPTENKNDIIQRVIKELTSYFENPNFEFSVPLQTAKMIQMNINFLLDSKFWFPIILKLEEYIRTQNKPIEIKQFLEILGMLFKYLKPIIVKKQKLTKL